ncbi:hypothetical protein CLU79DRAFT_832353 [Phycomyces nitens]|nr:hypothetical protein CLU79DRAFT_832353 [Phycomyces nitens]
MPPKKNTKHSKPAQDGPIEPVTNDPRFKHLQRDPRFLRPKKKDMKVSIDKRFSGMLNSEEFGSKPKVDKYGRKLEGNTAEKELKRYYRIDDDEEEEEEEEDNLELLEKALMADEGNVEDEEDAEAEQDEEVMDKLLSKSDYMRGKGVMSSSDESSSDEDEVEEEDEDEEEEQQPQIQEGEETCRLAAVNMDWDKIKAVDIFKVLSGFIPSTSVIKSVSIYPSEFGKERIKREDVEGPPKEIFNDNKGDDASDDDEEVTEASIIRAQVEEGDGKEFDQEALRKYQRDRLKYYYAVIECDTPATAKAIYQSCDGNEYESSANFFDLRYIPDEMEFTDQPKDVATMAPENHKPTKFITEALQHTKVKLTWDNDDLDRIQLTRREFTQDDIKDLDFDAYLASSDEEEDEEDVDSLREKYRKLLAGSGDKSVYGGKDEDHSDAEGDMEISFAPGLSEKTGALVDSKDAKDPEEETSIEKYMRKQREKRKAKKERRGEETKEEASEESDMGEEMNDPYFKETLQEMEDEGLVETKDKKKKKEKKSKKKLSKEQREEQRLQKADLELLMDDKEGKGDGFDMKEVLKREKLEKKGKKGKNAKKLETMDVDEFEINVADPRFADLQESHHFAIDPTNPQFKKTKSMKKLLDARQEKMKKESTETDTWKKEAAPARSSKADEGEKDNTSLSQLVNSVKRKGALSKPSLGKRQKM